VALWSAKRLGGTRLEPFGRNQMRRAEAGLAEEFPWALQMQMPMQMPMQIVKSLL
jgi:hypothetical protein